MVYNIAASIGGSKFSDIEHYVRVVCIVYLERGEFQVYQVFEIEALGSRYLKLYDIMNVIAESLPHLSISPCFHVKQRAWPICVWFE